MNRRVFLLVGSTLSLYEWQDKTLLGTYTFSFNENGFSLFKETLAKLPVCPAQLLVSMVNEDFYQEKVPHVRKGERDLVVKRHVKKYFRDEKYTSVVFQGRETEGRKDDVILISSIASNKDFDHWLSLMHEMQVPLIGIWSTPLFFEPLLKKVLAKKENIIFINRERDGNYRQSLFVKGNLILSRVTNAIEQTQSAQEKLQAIDDFVNQLYKFSTNKRILSFDSQVVVFCGFDGVSLPDLQAVSQSDHVEYRDFDLDAEDFDKRLVRQCIKNYKNTPHYAHKEDQREFSIVQKNKRLYQALALVSFLMFASSGAIAIKAMDIYRNADADFQSALSLEQEYRENFSDVDQYLGYADQSKSLVDKILLKQFNSSHMPTDIFFGLSSVLSMGQFEDLITNQILWKRYSGSELDSISRLFESLNNQADTLNASRIQGDQKSQDVIYIHISGDYFVDNISYDQAINTMNNFKRELNKLKEISAVYMSRIPIDLRLDSRFNDEGGFLVSEEGRNDSPSMFEFILEYHRE